MNSLETDNTELNSSVQEKEDDVNKTSQQGVSINNNISQQGNGHNEVNIFLNTISSSTEEEFWQIELLNEVDKRVEIGSDLIFDFVINTPPSQFSTPYVLYGAYYLKNKWIQFCDFRVSAGQSHIKLTIDTYKLGIKGAYFFSFDLFRAEDYSEGNSCAKYTNEYILTGENMPYSGSDNVLYRGVVKGEVLDYFTIKGQKYYPDTESLTLSDVNDSDIKSIACLRNLKYLSISGSSITSIWPLSNLQKLEDLYIHSNKLHCISAIKDMQNLVSLSIGGENRNCLGIHGEVEDISDIENLTKLKSLTIYDCKVENIKCIDKLKLLEYVDIHNTEVKDISPLAELRFVETLKLHSNNISDITAIYNLPNLSHLTLSYNNFTNEQLDSLRKHLPNCDVYNY